MIEELGLPVGAEALRLRAKAEGWEKGGAVQPKLAKPKLGKKKTKLGKQEAAEPRKPKHTPVNPGKCDVPLAGEVAPIEAPAGPDLDVTKLPLRWQVFVEEYLIDFNGTQAAIRVGYSAKSACQIGTENRYSRKRLL